MIRINLLEEAKAKKGKGAKVAVAATPGGPPRWLIPAGVAFSAILILLMGAWYFKVHSEAEKKVAENANLEKQLKEKEPFLLKQKEAETQKQLLEDRINQILQLKEMQQGPVYLMKRLYEVKPSDGIWFIEVKVADPEITVGMPPPPAAPGGAPGRGAPVANPGAPGAAPAAPVARPNSVITIKGRGVNPTVVTQFVTQIEAHRGDWFPSVTLRSIKAITDTETGPDGREFEMDVEFAQPQIKAPGVSS